MARLTIIIPDAKLNRVLDGASAALGYSPWMDAEGKIPNPLSKARFIKQQIIVWLKNKAVQGNINSSYETLNNEFDGINLT